MPLAASAYDACVDQARVIALDVRAAGTSTAGLVTITNSPTVYDTLLSSSADLTTTFQVVTSTAQLDASPFPIPGSPLIQGWVTIYDEQKLDEWVATQFVPGFVNGQEAPGVPSINDAVLDIDIIAPRYLSPYEYYHLKMRVQKSDGAAAVVYFAPAALPKPTGLNDNGLRCNAGPWWQFGRVCCHVQFFFCNLTHTLLPGLCNNCTTCYANCLNCSVNNPCHSCDPCGGTWLICRFFGHC
jgi:hypothetical protein